MSHYANTYSSNDQSWIGLHICCCISVFFNATQLHTQNRVVFEKEDGTYGRNCTFLIVIGEPGDKRILCGCLSCDILWSLWETCVQSIERKALAPTFMPCIYLQFTGCLTAQKFSQRFLWTGGGSSFFWWDDFLRSKPNLNLIEFFPVTSLQNIGLTGMVHYLPFFTAPNPK